MPTDDIFYIVAQDGMYIYKKIGILESLVPVKNISILQPIMPMIKMHVSKIQAAMIAKVLGIFRTVYEKYKAEAEVNIFYNEKTKKHRFVVPVQKVSSARVEYERKNPFTDWVMLGTIHSHAGMNAFHSGVDKDDEHSFDGLHITLGDMDYKDKFSIAASIVSNGTRITVDPKDYISGLVLVEELKEVPRATKYFRWENSKFIEVTHTSTVTPIACTTKKYYTLKTSPKSYLFDLSLLDNIEEKKYEPGRIVYTGYPGYHGYTGGMGGMGAWSGEWDDYYGGAWWNDPRSMYDRKPEAPVPHSVFGPQPGVTPIQFPDRSTVESLLADENEDVDVYIERGNTFVPINIAQATKIIDSLDDDDFNPCMDCIHRDEKLNWILEHATEIDEADDKELDALTDKYYPRIDLDDQPYFNSSFDEVNRQSLETIQKQKGPVPFTQKRAVWRKL
jgi:hypothetical protein